MLVKDKDKGGGGGQEPAMIALVFEHGAQPPPLDSGNVHVAFDKATKKVSLATGADELRYVNRAGLTGEDTDTDTDTVFLIRNKTTGQVRFVTATSALMRAEVDADADADQTDGRVVTPKSSAPDEFGDAFGSKRFKRALDRKKKSVIDSEVMKDKLEKIVAEKSVSPTDLADHRTVDDGVSERYAPPMNRDAKIPAEVYSASDVIGPAECESLREIAEGLLRGDEDGTGVEELGVSDYVRALISERRKKSGDEMSNVCLLLYADRLIKFLGDDYRTISRKSYVVCEYSSPLNDLVLKSFSLLSDRGRTRPVAHKDKAACHLLVALLLANDFVVPKASRLAAKIGVPATKLAEIVKVIGARYSPNDKNGSIVLKIPLCPPPVGRQKRKR